MIVANKEGRPRKIKTPKALEALWAEFKEYCNTRTAVTTAFSQKSGEFVTAIIPKPITYTIKGFCVFVGLTERDFYAVYDKDEKFQSVIARMKEECEIDARQKFENGTIDSRLAGLWMSNYGYSTKAETNMEMKNKVVIVDDLDG
jgi:hypothetical protein